MDKTNLGRKSKTELRSRMIKKRAELELDAAVQKSKTICCKLLESPWYKGANRILVYAAIRGEVDLTFFVEKAWADGKEVFFPKVSGQRMDFFAVKGWEELEPGNFGVPEPVRKEAGAAITGEERQAVILVPGVAFSEKGARIGYGKGYYDRYLSEQKELFPVGIAYEMQMVGDFDRDDFDIPMKKIVTELREVDCDDRIGNPV